MRTKPLLIVFVCLALAPMAVADEPSCRSDGSETFGDCFNRIFETSREELESENAKKKKESIEAGAAALDRKTTPDEAPNTASALKDFLPRLITTLGFGDFSEDKDSQTFSFGIGSKSSSKPALVKFVRREATLFEPTVNAIPSAIRNDRKLTLEEQLGDFDDVELSVSVNIESKRKRAGEDQLRRWRMGRSLDRYSDVTSAVYDAVTSTPDNAAMMKLLEIQEREAFRNVGLNISTNVAGAYSDDATRHLAASFEKLVIQAALTEFENLKSLGETLERNRYFVLADLANNQPQLHVEASYRERDDLTGPSEWGVKATYEHGFNNINLLLKECGSSIEDASAAGADEADRAALRNCYTGFVGNNPSNSANRLSVAAEYGQTDSYAFELPADMFMFQLDDVEKAIASAAYGRTLTYNKNRTRDLSRIDFEAKYEDVSGDPMRNNRLVASTTYTQNLANNNVVSIGLVYASKPEYLGEVDQEVSARFGLKFKLDKNEKKQN